MTAPRRAVSRLLVPDASQALVLGALVLLTAGPAAEGQVPPRSALDAAAYTIMAVTVAVLVLRRVLPLVTLGVTSAGIAAYLALDYPYGPVLLPLVLAAYSVGAQLPTRRSAFASGVALLIVLAGHVPTSTWSSLFTEAPSMLLGGTGVVVAPWAVGTVARLYREASARMREEEARQRAHDERIRVVQEVHDVVGHGLSAIHLQSGVALHVLDERPEQARPALEAISRTSKEALDELRATLAVFRDSDDPASREPAAGLDDLDALRKRMSDAGLDVDIRVSGTRVRPPAAVSLAAYRIVQESLTNVLRHAGRATVTVDVRHRDGAVDLEISDDGTASPPDEAPPAGTGLTGMRARATAVGGTLRAGPRPSGGFVVRAHLPHGAERDGGSRS